LVTDRPEARVIDEVLSLTTSVLRVIVYTRVTQHATLFDSSSVPAQLTRTEALTRPVVLARVRVSTLVVVRAAGTRAAAHLVHGTAKQTVVTVGVVDTWPGLPSTVIYSVSNVQETSRTAAI
jgi:hypothetical protein